MNIDYKENMPKADWMSQMSFLKMHRVDNPEAILKEFVVISKNICCFKSGLEDVFSRYYKQIPFTQIKEMAVDGNRTVCFFIVMKKSWWEFVENMYDGDLSQFAQTSK